MKAAVLSEVDGPLEVVEVPDPVAGDGKTLVRVRAAGINFADVMIRRGVYPQMPELPAILGNEIAGELEDGTRVMGFAGGAGGYAELVAVDPSSLVPLPAQASFAEGASFLLTFLTAYIPLTRQVVLRDGATVLVYAGAGGVGTAAIQVAQALGGRAIAAVGSPEKRDVCLQARRRGGVRLRRAAGGSARRRRRRPRRRPALRRLARAPARARDGDRHRLGRGRLGSGRPARARRTEHRRPGLLPRPADAARSRRRRGRDRRAAGAVGARRKLKPLVGAELPLAEIEQAHELVESRRSVGKVVLVP